MKSAEYDPRDPKGINEKGLEYSSGPSPSPASFSPRDPFDPQNRSTRTRTNNKLSQVKESILGAVSRKSR